MTYVTQTNYMGESLRSSANGGGYCNSQPANNCPSQPIIPAVMGVVVDPSPSVASASSQYKRIETVLTKAGVSKDKIPEMVTQYERIETVLTKAGVSKDKIPKMVIKIMNSQTIIVIDDSSSMLLDGWHKQGASLAINNESSRWFEMISRLKLVLDLHVEIGKPPKVKFLNARDKSYTIKEAEDITNLMKYLESTNACGVRVKTEDELIRIQNELEAQFDKNGVASQSLVGESTISFNKKHKIKDFVDNLRKDQKGYPGPSYKVPFHSDTPLTERFTVINNERLMKDNKEYLNIQLWCDGQPTDASKTPEEARAEFKKTLASILKDKNACLTFNACSNDEAVIAFANELDTDRNFGQQVDTNDDPTHESNQFHRGGTPEGTLAIRLVLKNAYGGLLRGLDGLDEGQKKSVNCCTVS